MVLKPVEAPLGYARALSCGSSLQGTWADGLRRTSRLLRDVVYQLRASTHQRLARTDDGHVGLALFAPVLEWVQQLRIQSCHSCQVLKASTSSVLRLFE